MSLEAWGDDGDCDRPYTQERVDEIVAEAVEELKVLIEDTANMLRGMTLDPAIPNNAKEAMRARIAKLEGGKP